MISILLVDDQDYIRDLLHDMLPECGLGEIVIHDASDGLQAIEVIAKEDVDLVLTDVRMPNLGGLVLARHIRDQHPETRVLMMTGYSLDSLVEGFQVISKPFGLSSLQAAIHETLA